MYKRKEACSRSLLWLGSTSELKKAICRIEKEKPEWQPLHMSSFTAGCWQREPQSEEAMPRQKEKKKKKLFILCGQLRETGSQSVSYKRYERWRGSARACGRDRERERAGERREGNVEGGREGEVLQATGYLSLHNGVSYEKTSVNFLSDLQQSITQSSHSANLWSRALTESCHCSQPPNTQRAQLWSH